MNVVGNDSKVVVFLMTAFRNSVGNMLSFLLASKRMTLASVAKEKNLNPLIG